MKRIQTLFTLMVVFFAASAQDNKPEPGKTGIGLSMSGGVGNRVVVSRTLKGGLEPGLQFGLNHSKSNNTAGDSVTVQTNQGPERASRMNNIVNPGTAITVVPFILKHATIESNIDAFCGLQVPMTFGMAPKSTTTTTISRADYENETVSESTSPGTTTVGVNLVLGCQWFFIKNLAIGAVCGIGGSMSSSKGNIETTTTVTNSGSANPMSTVTIQPVTTSTTRDNKNTSIATFNNFLGFYLTYYL
jgi:hypothetical protein